jgi:hypothetical protein
VGIIVDRVELGPGARAEKGGTGSRIESSVEEARDDEAWEDIMRRSLGTFG